MQSAILVRKAEQDARATLKEGAVATPVARAASVGGPRIHDFARLGRKNGWTQEVENQVSARDIRIKVICPLSITVG